MAKPVRPTDFRATRTLLSSGPTPGPTDLVSDNVWSGIMHLPDDVAIRTSDHHGSQLATLESLWGDWLEAMGNQHDELFAGMLDAADCFQASTFDSLHGYYRSALSNMRSGIELVAIGSLGNLTPKDKDYLRWRKENLGSLPFGSCIKKLRRVTKATVPTSVFAPNGWMETLYQELCAYAHSRPDASDGEMRRSNGPIYVTAAFDRIFELQVSTYAAGYVLAMVGRPKLVLLKSSEFLFTTTQLLCRDDIASSHRALSALRQP